MTFVVIVAKRNSGKPNKVYEGSRILKILRKIQKDHSLRTIVGWTEEMEEYLRANYRNMSRSQLAKIMSVRFDKDITRNSVISRCSKLGLCERKHERSKNSD